MHEPYGCLLLILPPGCCVNDVDLSEWWWW